VRFTAAKTLDLGLVVKTTANRTEWRESRWSDKSRLRTGHEKAADNSPAAGNQFVDDFVDGYIRQTTTLFS
jgi:hypothetical protein